VPIINNNVRLEDQEWGTEHAPNLDINSAGEITVIKGASSLQYGGDAVGGLVIIEPISVKKDSVFGKTIFNFDSNGRRINDPWPTAFASSGFDLDAIAVLQNKQTGIKNLRAEIINPICYPNPLHQNENLQIQLASANESTIKIYNRIGQLLMESNYRSSQIVLPLHFNESILLLECLQNNQVFKTKIILQ
jgi:outer membrane receptor protein involved in Fe transport